MAEIEALNGDRIVLRTPIASEETFLAWEADGPYRVELELDPQTGRVALAATAPEGATARLESPLFMAPGAVGRLEVVIGEAPAVTPRREPAWGARFSNLLVTARNVCG
jgi:hypothetical protein